ncbi:protein of unknown function [Methylocaldum szegediense]|uniref:Uncharacterized protein n=1 Tax=Methylocaldum szegediense TaxID=73780 RepID=A0ABN8X1U5_9GAMM|nr:protein of unknown function [Methylocaldum szegediense]
MVAWFVEENPNALHAERCRIKVRVWNFGNMSILDILSFLHPVVKRGGSLTLRLSLAVAAFGALGNDRSRTRGMR